MRERFEAAGGALLVRPLTRGERGRFDAALATHHWLGHRLVGETMRYVATDEGGHWLALAGFGAAALSCRPRDAFIGWSAEQQFRRLAYVVNNQRFCVLPEGRRPNLASAVLARCCRRLSGDYERVFGHPVLVVETFVDPARHRGACYAAAGFERLGETAGYGRRAGRYVHHGRPKLCFARLLRRDARRVLAAPFDHPLLVTAARRPVMLDLNDAAIEGPGGLLERLAALADHRKRRGVRHSLASVLAVAAAAVCSGASSFTAIGEWAAEAPQAVLARLGARRHPRSGRRVAPHEATIRRALQHVDVDALDATVGAWMVEQVRAGRIADQQLAVAVDGKALRGAVGEDGRPAHLFAAMVHHEAVVIAQREVDHKHNEITEFRPLLDPLDLDGAVVTADALHAQRDHARFLVEDKAADYVFTVKGNQPSLLDGLERLYYDSFPPSPGD